MAYGNWGAFVFRDGERMLAWEDQTPYREGELPAGYQQAFARSDKVNPHHAVLGQRDVRWCGYKSGPVLFVRGEEVKDLRPYVTAWEGDDKRTFEYQGVENYLYAEAWVGEVDGYRFKAERANDVGSIIELELVEPDGVTWTSRCGYMIGAGHDD